LKSIVLLSAGLDSVVNLAFAARKTRVRAALTFDYGQKAAKREAYFSAQLARYYGVESVLVKLPFYKKIGKAGLLKGEVPKVKAEELEDKEILKQKSLQVWVPSRNLVFLAVAAVFAEYLGAEKIVAGFNLEESQNFPDNSFEFLKAVNDTLVFSTLKKVEAISYTLNMTKKDIVQKGMELKIPWEFVWSCYRGSEKMCGQCESCQRLIRASQGSTAWEVLKGRFKNA